MLPPMHHLYARHRLSARVQSRSTKIFLFFGTCFRRKRLLHIERPPIEGRAVELLDGLGSLAIVVHQDISKSERLSAVAITNDSSLDHVPIALEQCLHLIGGSQ